MKMDSKRSSGGLQYKDSDGPFDILWLQETFTLGLEYHNTCNNDVFYIDYLFYNQKDTANDRWSS